MKEQLREPREIGFRCEDAELYMKRLAQSCETLRSIDDGNFPLTHYSSGEVTKRFVNASGQVTREEYAELPIFQPSKGREKGLRFAVTHAIFSDLRMCQEMGIGQEAKEIVDLYRRVKK